MAILSKTIPVKIGAHPDYYRAKGYEMPMKEASKLTQQREKKLFVIDKQKQVDVKIDDLPLTCQLPIFVECDICHNHLWTNYDIYNRSLQKDGYYVCRTCSPIKQSMRMKAKYGVDNASKLPRFHEKIANAWKKKSQDELNIINEKRRLTFQEKYGVDGPMDVPEFVEKQKKTVFGKYGVEYSTQSPEVYAKIAYTLYKNGTSPCSSQQMEIYNVLSMRYQCELNYPVKQYSGDIVILDDMIDIEYDGSGHDLCVYRGALSKKEFERKEIIRNIVFKNAGYKVIRIISKRDWLPSEEKLFEILDISKEYFNTTSHSWIDFNIDGKIMRNAEHMDGVPFDFGELHKVQYETKEDI